MKINNIRYALLLPVLLAGCTEERPCDTLQKESACIRLTVDSDAPSKSSLLASESLVMDLNIWVYSSSGQFVESFYLNGLSITSSGSVNVTTTAGGHSRLVVIGNAGRALSAPSLISERAQVAMQYENDSSGMMVMVGEGRLSLTSTGMQSSVELHRAMSRIALRVALDPSLAAEGGVLGGNVRISRAGFFNSPSVLSVLPSAAWESARSFKAVQGTPFASGDNLSTSDIASLYSGGTVYLYGLPNFTDIPYSDAPAAGTQYSSFIEMLLEFDGIGNVGEGRVLCRFYANDGAWIGLKGGCSYTCQVVVSNDGASNSWRKDDFRLDTPDTFLAGEEKTVFLHSRNHDAQAVGFSLSETTGVSENGVFRIGEKVTGTYLQGVKVIAKTAGAGTLYCFNSSNELMGSTPITSVWPQISVPDKTLDVTGIEVPLDLQGLDAAYSKRASDELFASLYSVASVEPAESVSGLYGQDFIYSGASDALLYVKELGWTREGTAKTWTDAVGKTFPYRATLACGISADFNVSVSNAIVSPLRGNNYFGEAFDVSEVEDPLPAVAALASQNTITAAISASVPESFCTPTKAQWQVNGWRSWFGGALLEAGTVADSYIDSWSGSGIRWILPSDAVKSLYGDAVPIYIGKLNPHCGEYVREQVGYYASTIYHPVGVDLYIELLDYSGDITTCLCFRPHLDETVLDIDPDHFAHQGFDGGALYSNHTGIGMYGYAFTSSGDYLETNWDGNLLKESEFNYGSGPFFGTSAFSYNVRSPYSGAAFGAKNGKHLAVYQYAPYTYQDSHAEIADNNGHVGAKGYVSVEKWSVSSRAFFDWPEELFVRPSLSEDP